MATDSLFSRCYVLGLVLIFHSPQTTLCSNKKKKINRRHEVGRCWCRLHAVANAPRISSLQGFIPHAPSLYPYSSSTQFKYRETCPGTTFLGARPPFEWVTRFYLKDIRVKLETPHPIWIHIPRGRRGQQCPTPVLRTDNRSAIVSCWPHLTPLIHPQCATPK